MVKTLGFYRAIWSVFLLGTLSFLGFRLAQLLQYGDLALLSQQADDLIRAFWIGIRFDLKVLAMGLPVFVLASLIAVVRWLCTIGAWLQRCVIVFLFFCINFAAACQYFYYGFYKTPFTPLIFGLVEDDTQGILSAIWSDYPVILAMGLIIGLTLIQAFLTLRWSTNTQSFTVKYYLNKSLWAKSGILFLTVLAIIFFGRGRFFKSPLRSEEASVSVNPFINDLIRNAWQALYDAVKERREYTSFISNDPTQQLPAYGFHSLDEVAKVLGVASGSVDELERFIFRRTPQNAHLRRHPPHVVFALMESWGSHPLKFHTQQNNLLGAMEKHLNRGIHFTNFFATQTSTHPTLEALLLNSPLTPLTLGSYGWITYPVAAVKPFKVQGYRTVLIYGGPQGWRSIGRVLQRQYFDEIYDMNVIMARYPRAQRTMWGVYDEYVFRLAYDLLQEAETRQEKLLIFLLTTTNHSPHQLPVDYQALPLDLTAMQPFASNLRDPQKAVLTYQYSNHQLGLFLDRIDRSALGKKTIVAATGDHNMHALLPYRQPTDSKDMYRVPGYFYIPLDYQPKYPPDTLRYAGHRDLFPTLYHLALSDAVYPAFGHNLFAPLSEQQQFAIVSCRLLFSQSGALLPCVGQKSTAFQWDANGNTLTISENPMTLLQAQCKQARAWIALTDWYTRYQILQLKVP